MEEDKEKNLDEIASLEQQIDRLKARSQNYESQVESLTFTEQNLKDRVNKMMIEKDELRDKSKSLDSKLLAMQTSYDKELNLKNSKLAELEISFSAANKNKGLLMQDLEKLNSDYHLKEEQNNCELSMRFSELDQ
jgi:predicted RNase H-like nuclease (RuvC/YqgF family)